MNCMCIWLIEFSVWKNRSILWQAEPKVLARVWYHRMHPVPHQAAGFPWFMRGSNWARLPQIFLWECIGIEGGVYSVVRWLHFGGGGAFQSGESGVQETGQWNPHSAGHWLVWSSRRFHPELQERIWIFSSGSFCELLKSQHVPMYFIMHATLMLLRFVFTVEYLPDLLFLLAHD